MVDEDHDLEHPMTNLDHLLRHLSLADLLRKALQAALRENNKDAYRRIQEVLAYCIVSDANLRDLPPTPQVTTSSTSQPQPPVAHRGTLPP